MIWVLPDNISIFDHPTFKNLKILSISVMWSNGRFLYSWLGSKLLQPLWRAVGNVITVKKCLPQDTAITLLGMYSVEMLACMHVHAKSLQPCPTLWDTMNCSPPGSSAHGILQARILKWVAMPWSRGSSRPKDWTFVSYISWIGKWVHYH